ncbi:Cys-tRNA(Pro) deacylase [Roseomonas sp. KE0001]|uniref:Cys-tRNA(Pro) deacylase n=1 Tax=unclassified Roseomonas TaxID=2617492 RepID=UPI0018DEFDDC|nr:Cys-tRNA(Pro) deacylase [Roseomonas sp. KE0001]MBI0434318.1 Cys-tRNA(Pro) deacylase [Roseomonas sp. KE0001]
MSRVTRATQALDRAGIAFALREYAYDPEAASIGLHAAAAIGEPPARVLKTLMAAVDGRPVCVVIPSDREASMKRLAAAFGGRQARMLSPAEAERITGYHVGGISPFGQRRAVPVAIEASALSEPYIFVNGGQRGLQLRLDPAAALAALGGRAAPLIA